MVTAPGSGAEIIPFLKTWVNLPMAIGFTVLYAKVCVALVPDIVGSSWRGLLLNEIWSVRSSPTCFLQRLFSMCAFFLLWPSLDHSPSSCTPCEIRFTLHVSHLRAHDTDDFSIVSCLNEIHGSLAARAEFCERLLENWGARFGGPIAILRNWTFCLFYVMAELWGSVVVSLLFWGFANQVFLHAPFGSSLKAHAAYCPIVLSCSDHKIPLELQITSVDEAKTFYPLFGLGANVALIFSGRAVKYFSEV